MEEINQIKEIFSINVPDFHQLKEVQISELIQKNKTISPVIRETFELLINQCLDDFNFIKNPISFDQYLSFFQEVNRLIPKLKKKILIDDIEDAPVFFVGDTHGAIHQSFLIIEFFFQFLKHSPKSKLIFVGDYVDRNPYDLENLTLIVAFYLLCPNNVVLIRGNHEDRLINENYGFIDNLLRVFWDKGEILYDEIIKFFIHLPIAHISQIHKNNQLARVLTVHGGIPIDPLNFMDPIILTEIESQLDCEKPDSNQMDPLTVSILWSDPDEMIKEGILTGDHFNGRMQFGRKVFDAFMNANNLHLLVRGHQKWNEGCRIFFDGKLYSLFSTASYDGKIRFNPKILRLEFGKTPKLIGITEEELQQELQ